MLDLGGGATLGGYPKSSKSFFFLHLRIYKAIPIPIIMAAISRQIPTMSITVVVSTTVTKTKHYIGYLKICHIIFVTCYRVISKKLGLAA